MTMVWGVMPVMSPEGGVIYTSNPSAGVKTDASMTRNSRLPEVGAALLSVRTPGGLLLAARPFKTTGYCDEPLKLVVPLLTGLVVLPFIIAVIVSLPAFTFV